MRPTQIAFKILNKRWVIRLMKKKKFNDKNGADNCAITKVHKRRIDLSPSGRDLETITHELCHAYKGEMCIHSSALDADAVEEFFCELVAKRGQEIIDLAIKLHKEVQAIEGKEN